MSDISQKIKLKILTQLENTPEVVAIVPPSGMFTMKVDANATPPFIRYGRPEVSPFEDNCGTGASVLVGLHCHTAGEYEVQLLSAAVQKSLSALGDVELSEWKRTLFVPDPNEADMWQGIVTFEVVDRD